MKLILHRDNGTIIGILLLCASNDKIEKSISIIIVRR